MRKEENFGFHVGFVGKHPHARLDELGIFAEQHDPTQLVQGVLKLVHLCGANVRGRVGGCFAA